LASALLLGSHRLPPVSLQIPVDIAGKRRIAARFSENENITATVEGFANVFELDEVTSLFYSHEQTQPYLMAK
jgi:hypothetical protein